MNTAQGNLRCKVTRGRPLCVVRTRVMKSNPMKLQMAISAMAIGILATACGDDSNDPGGETVDADGIECGGDVNGREGNCYMESGEAFATKAVHEWSMSADDHNYAFGLGTSGCCEPHADPDTEDAECVRTCMRGLCQEAGIVHMGIVGATLLGCWNQEKWCGFEMSSCYSGYPTEHHVNTVKNSSNYKYHLDIDCESYGNQLRTESPPGSEIMLFTWAVDPNADKPEVCGASSMNAEPGGSLGYKADGSGGTGTKLIVDWMDVTGATGTETATPDDVVMEYEVMPCGANECVELSLVRLHMPSFAVVEGYVIDDAVMTITPVAGAAPSINSRGRFVYQPGELQAEIEFEFGGTLLKRSAVSSTRAIGRHKPGNNVAKLTKLEFDYDGTLIDATMLINVRGDFINRRPDAEITAILEPVSCADPVRFDAQSVDPDGDPMTHVWSVPKLDLSGTGNEFSVVLPAGEHFITMVSTDDSGARAGTGLEYTRECR